MLSGAPSSARRKTMCPRFWSGSHSVSMGSRKYAERTFARRAGFSVLTRALDVTSWYMPTP